MHDFLIIGGGLSGITAAHRLTELGYKVLLIEARDQVGEGTSYGNGAMLHPSLTDPWNTPGIAKVLAKSLFDSKSAMKLRLKALPSLAGWGIQFLKKANPKQHADSTQRLLELATFSISLSEKYRSKFQGQYDSACCGSLKLFRSKGDFQTAILDGEMLKPFGLSHECFNTEQTINKEPCLNSIRSEIAGSIFYAGDEVGDSHKFCHCLAQDMQQNGATIMTHCKASKLIIEDKQVKGVCTSQGDLLADNVLLATGSDPDGIAKKSGINLPIRPAKGYSITYDISELTQRPGLPVIDHSLHAAVVPVGDRLRAVGTAEFTGHDPIIRASRINNLKSLLQRVYPEITQRISHQKGERWAGFRPMTTNGLPIISSCPIKNLWINMGHGHLGWTLAMGSAHLLCDLIEKSQPKVNPEYFKY